MTNKIAMQDQPMDWQKEFLSDPFAGEVFGSYEGFVNRVRESLDPLVLGNPSRMPLPEDCHTLFTQGK
jgi:hypothetical protein